MWKIGTYWLLFFSVQANAPGRLIWKNFLDKPGVCFIKFRTQQISDSDLGHTTKRPRADWSNQRPRSSLIGF